MRLLHRKFAARAHNYIFQSFLATASLMVILLVQNAVFSAAIVAAIASTAFIVLWCPIASPRRLEGSSEDILWPSSPAP